jgi:hypothetical protein
MFEVKSIQLEQKISNENEIKLLFNTESTFPCLFPLLFSLRVIRFQSLSTQYSDLMALKDWYIFWYKNTLFPSANFSILQIIILNLLMKKLIILSFTSKIIMT